MSTLRLAALACWLGACASQDVVLLTVESGGSAGMNQGGASSGGAAQGGAAQGGTLQGGAAQGGLSQGGAPRGGASSGGAGGGMPQGGAAPGGMPAGGFGQGGGGPPPKPCRSNADCDPVFACEKQKCSDESGECRKRPSISCPSFGPPVCGCDGVNYWNDCLRIQAGAISSIPGECSNPVLCTRSVDCNVNRPAGNAQCGHLSPEPCNPGGPPVPGVCWVLPDSCSVQGNDTRWVDCQGPTNKCIDICTAIQSGHPHTQLGVGLSCQ
ncbi:MAG: hypothetical protein QM756_29490 [Polyangiaceae bacterium]